MALGGCRAFKEERAVDSASERFESRLSSVGMIVGGGGREVTGVDGGRRSVSHVWCSV